MKDKWMNMGYEEDELKPFTEPVLDITDEKRIDMLVTMGYCRAEVNESLRNHKFDDCYASYLLLGRKSTDVSQVFENYKNPLALLSANHPFPG
jgi:MAP/microtubule affinity-regulating kinase